MPKDRVTLEHGSPRPTKSRHLTACCQSFAPLVCCNPLRLWRSRQGTQPAWQAGVSLIALAPICQLPGFDSQATATADPILALLGADPGVVAEQGGLAGFERVLWALVSGLETSPDALLTRAEEKDPDQQGRWRPVAAWSPVALLMPVAGEAAAPQPASEHGLLPLPVMVQEAPQLPVMEPAALGDTSEALATQPQLLQLKSPGGGEAAEVAPGGIEAQQASMATQAGMAVAFTLRLEATAAGGPVLQQGDHPQLAHRQDLRQGIRACQEALPEASAPARALEPLNRPGASQPAASETTPSQPALKQDSVVAGQTHRERDGQSPTGVTAPAGHPQAASKQSAPAVAPKPASRPVEQDEVKPLRPAEAATFGAALSATAAQRDAHQASERLEGTGQPALMHESAKSAEAPAGREVTELSLLVSPRRATPGARPSVAVHLVDRGGRIQVLVRASDDTLAQSLRQELPSLVSQLERGGFQTESWAYASASAGELAPVATEREPGAASEGTGHQGRGAGQNDARQHDDQGAFQPRQGQADQEDFADFRRIHDAFLS